MGHLEATFDVMSLADVLQWIANSTKTGRCRFRNGAVSRTLYSQDGHLVACESDEPHLLLGQFLLYQGRIDEATLQRCMKRQESGGDSLGTILVQDGVLSVDELQRRVQAKAEETVLGLFDWDRCVFRFDPDVVPPATAMRVDLEIHGLLFEGARRTDECRHLATIFPSDDVVLHATDRPPAPSAIATHLGRTLYEGIDGKRTLGELILASRAPRFHAYSFLGRLVEIGVVRTGAIRRATPTSQGGDTAVRTLRELVDQEAWTDAIDHAELQDFASRHHDEVALLIARAEAGFLADAYRTATPPDSIPRVVGDVPLTREDDPMTEHEAFVLQVIDGQWDVRSLVWITPLRKVETVRALTRLVDRGVVEIVDPSRAEAAPVPASGMSADDIDGAVEDRIG